MLNGERRGRKRFLCRKCKKETYESCRLLSQPKPSLDGFVCPHCSSNRIRRSGKIKHQGAYKALYSCFSCNNNIVDFYSLDGGAGVKADKVAQSQPKPVKPFCFEDDIWDARALFSSLDDIDIRKGTELNFEELEPSWMKFLIKKFIKHEINSGRKIATLKSRLTVFRNFSRYLVGVADVTCIEHINRGLILRFFADYSKDKSVATVVVGLTCLKLFFRTGNLLKWFKVDEYIIDSDDYPKPSEEKSNDIPWGVLKQIEDNLHLLPDPIARMFLIWRFSAMRLSEVTLLSRNCLVQEGAGWTVEFWRKKGSNYHAIPVTRTLAGIIQEQQKYIDTHFDSEFEYLFCDFLGVSYKKLKQRYFTPARRIIGETLLCSLMELLIEELDIRDENGEQWHFINRQLRDTRLTHLFEEGHEFAVVQAWAGHKTTRTTQKYVNVKPELMRKETAHIQAILLNVDGQPVCYESLPITFRLNPTAHELAFPEDHINTPVYGFCGLPLDTDCLKGRACYTCRHFVATQDKLPLYIQQRNKLRQKQLNAEEKGQSVMADIYKQQADTLDKILVFFGEER